MAERALLEVTALHKRFPLRRSLAEAWSNRPRRAVQAAHDVSLRIAAGESFGLVGESGCGKTTLGRLVLGLLPVDDGAIVFEGQNVAHMAPAQRRVLRRRMQMVFQDPYSSLNPRMRVGAALAEPIRLHAVVPRDQVQAEVVRLLDRVGLGAATARRYPSELSGGQRQRVGIARALALRPRLLVADEAVSGLDVSVRAQVLNLLDDLRRELGLALLFISHDLGVIEYLCETVAVMYLGRIIESGPTQAVFASPAHPYTRALLRAVPRADPTAARDAAPPLAGEPPSPVDPPSGCAFRTRCPQAQAVCTTEPPRVGRADGHWAACHFAV
jgi:oligopeptide/dipeptide ABC transporter ATP-binding protein